MRKIIIILSIALISTFTIIPAQESTAGEVDCERMVRVCKKTNPYDQWDEKENKQYHAYNLGCMTAGQACTIMKA
jgi:hypothetical protein